MSVKGHWDRTKDRKRARKTYAGINWRERMAKNIAVKKSVMYGEIDSSCCYELSYFEDIINDGEAESLILESWEKVTGNGLMWCVKNWEPIGSGEGVCGKFECENYSPCNGKSGRCRHLKNTYELNGVKFKLTKDGLEELTQEISKIIKKS